MEGKILSIAPVSGVKAVYKMEDGSEDKTKVHLAALLEIESSQGKKYTSVCFLEADSAGDFDDPTETSNFVRFEFE